MNKLSLIFAIAQIKKSLFIRDKIKLILILTVLVLVLGALFIKLDNNSLRESVPRLNGKSTNQNEGGLTNIQHPLSIEYMRRQNYPGSDLVIEQKLSDGANYYQYIASYKSEGLKIYGLLSPNR